MPPSQASGSRSPSSGHDPDSSSQTRRQRGVHIRMGPRTRPLSPGAPGPAPQGMLLHRIPQALRTQGGGVSRFEEGTPVTRVSLSLPLSSDHPKPQAAPDLRLRPLGLHPPSPTHPMAQPLLSTCLEMPACPRLGRRSTHPPSSSRWESEALRGDVTPSEQGGQGRARFSPIPCYGGSPGDLLALGARSPTGRAAQARQAVPLP